MSRLEVLDIVLFAIISYELEEIDKGKFCDVIMLEDVWIDYYV